MLVDVVNQLNAAGMQLRMHIGFLLSIMAIAWVVQFANAAVGYRLCVFGIVPRTVLGLFGILFSPWLHGSFNHIFMNSLFFLTMGSMLIIQGKQMFVVVSIALVLLSGLLVWLFANRASHVGASSVIMGYWSFLMARAYYHPDLIDLIAAGAGLYYCGVHLTASLLDDKKGVSMAGHAFGFISGIIIAAYYRQVEFLVLTYILPLL